VFTDFYWHVSKGAVNGLLDKRVRILAEDCSFGCTSQVVELVLVKDCELRALAAVNKLLALLPSNWAHVTELTQGLLQINLIVVEIRHHATPVTGIIPHEEVVTGKLQTSSDRIF